jgi:type II secretory pathway pseudopilin PulG
MTAPADRTRPDRPARHRRRRAGFSLLEAQVAFVLLGIGLAGVVPVVLMETRMARKINLGIQQDSSYGGQIPVTPGVNCLVVPPNGDDPRAILWARKLGVSASFRPESYTGATWYAPAVPVAPNALTIVSPAAL